MSSDPDPMQQHRYTRLTDQIAYERWRSAVPRGALPDPDPYLCDHGVVGGFYVNPATGRPGCPFCRARPAVAWRQVRLSSPLPGTIRHRAEPA